jgi:hypothetical protein
VHPILGGGYREPGENTIDRKVTFSFPLPFFSKGKKKKSLPAAVAH